MNILFTILIIIAAILLLLVFLLLFVLFCDIKISYLYYDEIKFIVIKYLFLKKHLNTKKINEIFADSETYVEDVGKAIVKDGESDATNSNNNDEDKSDIKTRREKRKEKNKNEQEEIDTNVNDVIEILKDKKNLGQALDIVKSFGASIKGVLSKTEIRQFYLEIMVSGDDPYDIAIKYGDINAVVYAIIPIIKNIVIIKNEKIIVKNNFINDKGYIKSKGQIVIKPIYILTNSRHLFIKIFKFYKKIK